MAQMAGRTWQAQLVAAGSSTGSRLSNGGSSSCFMARPRRRQQPQQLLPSPAALPPGLESTGSSSGSGTDALLASMQQAAAQQTTAYAAELLLTAVAAYVAAAWPSRPRGWCDSQLVTVGPSEVPGAGRGVFAQQPIAAGTVIGAYPGRPRTPQQMEAKCEAAPGARDYCFRTRGGVLLDPTDAQGRLSNSPAPGLPWLPIDATLGCVNEPPRGAGGTNVTVEDDPADTCGLLCVAARDIQPGQELFMDYGVTYDRSKYVGAGQAAGSEAGGQAGDSTSGGGEEQ